MVVINATGTALSGSTSVIRLFAIATPTKSHSHKSIATFNLLLCAVTKFAKAKYTQTVVALQTVGNSPTQSLIKRAYN